MYTAARAVCGCIRASKPTFLVNRANVRLSRASFLTQRGSVDVIIAGGGQAGLAAAYFLESLGNISYIVLDGNTKSGGAWQHRWSSLKLFSTRKWSSLPGLPMYQSPRDANEYPTTQEMRWYLEEYEQAMGLNVLRPMLIKSAHHTNRDTITVNAIDPQSPPGLLGGGGGGQWECRALINATGTHTAPRIPRLMGSESFKGLQLHSSQYQGPEGFRGKNVAVVGEGNSGAQLLAELSEVAATCTWVCKNPPVFLGPEVSGRDIFDSVAAIRKAKGRVDVSDIPSLTSIIQVPPVKAAKEKGVYDQVCSPADEMTPTGLAWRRGSAGIVHERAVDAVIWCTGYHNATEHLAPLGVVNPNTTVDLDSTRAVATPNVFLCGYGNWSGIGSGSIPGAVFHAKQTVREVAKYLTEAKQREQLTLSIQKLAQFPGAALGQQLVGA